MTHRPRSMFARWARRLAGAATLVLVAGTTTVLGQAPAGAAVACEVTYTANEWTSGPNQGGFTANVTIKNLGDPLTGWTLGLRLPHHHPAVTPRAGAPTGASPAARSPPRTWPGTATSPPAPSTTIGFNGTWSGSNPKPTAFTINGTTCGGTHANQPPTVSLDLAGRRPDLRRARPPCRSPRPPATRTAPIAKVEFYRNGSRCSTPTPPPRTPTAGRTCRPAATRSPPGRTTTPGATTTSSPVGDHRRRRPAARRSWSPRRA